MKRFKVGDMVIFAKAGEMRKAQPYLGMICEIVQSPAYCDCIWCLLENGGKPSKQDYRIRFADDVQGNVMDDQLKPIIDPDKAVDQEQHEELTA